MRYKTFVKYIGGPTTYPIGQFLNTNKKIVFDMLQPLLIKLGTIKRKPYIRIWCIGSSGCILSTFAYNILSEAGYNVCIEHVPKLYEDRHSSGVRTYFGNKKVFEVIIDDFIVSGDSINRIIDYIKQNTLIKKVHALIVSGCDKESKVSNAIKFDLFISDKDINNL